jgi:hypothetical protein
VAIYQTRVLPCVYLASCCVPWACVVVGLIGASHRPEIEGWELIGFLLVGSAYGFVNLLGGLVVLFSGSDPRRLRMAVFSGFILGGLVPSAGFLLLVAR